MPPAVTIVGVFSAEKS